MGGRAIRIHRAAGQPARLLARHMASNSGPRRQAAAKVTASVPSAEEDFESLLQGFSKSPPAPNVPCFIPLPRFRSVPVTTAGVIATRHEGSCRRAWVKLRRQCCSPLTPRGRRKHRRYTRSSVPSPCRRSFLPTALRSRTRLFSQHVDALSKTQPPVRCPSPRKCHSVPQGTTWRSVGRRLTSPVSRRP